MSIPLDSDVEVAREYLVSTLQSPDVTFVITARLQAPIYCRHGALHHSVVRAFVFVRNKGESSSSFSRRCFHCQQLSLIMAYCDRCERYFGSERALEQHEENSSMHNMCHYCGRDFATAWGLTQHYVQSPLHHYCQRCDEHFDSARELSSHYEDDHHYCSICNQIFDSALGLHEHNRQKHWYCADCKRVFQSESNLRNHERSSIHRRATIPCPDQRCGRAFVSVAAMVLHLESGTCPSRMTREQINRLAARYDRNNVVTNPARLIRGPDGAPAPAATTRTWASERSWNGYGYECFLCHREYTSLAALNQHLASPAHADKMYRCPRAYSGCGAEFRTLSALCQHVESEQCEIRRFNRAVQDVVGSLASGMNRLTL